MKEKINPVNQKINRVDTTTDTITGRGGLALFARYLTTINIYPLLYSIFFVLRKSKKGKEITNIFKQIFCFFFDGTSFNITYFDTLKEDKGYAEVIENRTGDMCSSHEIRRFFKSFTAVLVWMFRRVLHELFIWRLKIKKPKLIEIVMDVVVMDNDEAEKREGVKVTYQGKKGFAPLKLKWEEYIIDTIFRGGDRHSNHANTAGNIIKGIVQLIRDRYSKEVPIIVKQDSGFFDEKLFEFYDSKLEIGFISSGRIYPKTKEIIELSRKGASFQTYENKDNIWEYYDFGYRYDSWDNFYRAIYTNAKTEDKQLLLGYAETSEIIVTNVGKNEKIFRGLKKEDIEQYCKATNLIERNHQRGKSELVHRGLKEFGTERLPLEKFVPNSAYYYCMVVAYFLFQAFKEDIAGEIVGIGSYANTVRRKIIDIAAKIVHSGGEIILKVTETVMESLNFRKLWYLANNASPI